MSTGKLVARNTIIQALGKAVSTLLGVAVVALVTRSLGPAGYGQYTTVITFLSFFGIVADLGLTIITAQMISERGADESRIVSSIFTFRLVSAFILFAIAPVVAYFTPYPAIVKIGIALTAWSFFFVSLQQTLIGIFQKNLVMRYPMIAENVGRLALLVFTVYAALNGKNLVWFLGAVVVGNVCSFFVTQHFARKIVPIRFAWDREIIREMWKRALPIAISIVFNLVYLKADTLILSLTRTTTEVGFYGAAYRVIDILMMVPVMIMGMILPIVTEAWSIRDNSRVERILQKTFDAFFIFAVPVLLGGLLVAERVMTLIAGSGFEPAGAPLRILLGAFVAATFSTLFGHFIVAIQKQRNVIWIYGIDAVLSLTAYFVFVPRFGMSAAAWATFFSEAFAALLLGWMVILTTRARIGIRVVIPVILSAIIMVLIVVLTSSWPVLLSIAVAAAVYCAVLIAARVHKQLI